MGDAFRDVAEDGGGAARDEQPRGTAHGVSASETLMHEADQLKQGQDKFVVKIQARWRGNQPLRQMRAMRAARPAALAFAGDTYVGLDAPSFSATD